MAFPDDSSDVYAPQSQQIRKKLVADGQQLVRIL